MKVSARFEDPEGLSALSFKYHRTSAWAGNTRTTLVYVRPFRKRPVLSFCLVPVAIERILKIPFVIAGYRLDGNVMDKGQHNQGDSCQACHSDCSKY